MRYTVPRLIFGNFLPHMQINCIRGGVVVSGEQEPFDGLPLTAVF